MTNDSFYSGDETALHGYGRGLHDMKITCIWGLRGLGGIGNGA